MALFGSKKKTAKPEVELAKSGAESVGFVPKKSSKKASAAVVVPSSHVLLRPRITEKAANMTSVSVYTFDVAPSATKKSIATAVKTLYKVTPVKVAVVTIHPRRVKMRRKRGYGMVAGGKKAYVYLKKGEEIQFA